jgi:5-deoxy-glucuronate isomerase
MGYLLEYKPCDGYTEIMKRGEYGLDYITFGILRLGIGEKFSEKSDSNEIGLIILTGKCSVKVGKYDYRSVGSRTSVFGGKAYGVYVPPNTDYEIIGEDKVEIALCKAPADLKAEPVLITPDQVNIRTVGQHNWRRYVHDIIDARITASKLVIGETFNPPGNWSSYPPHRHDYDNLPDESEQEELYFFKVEPPQGFGIQRIYTDDLSVNKVYVVQNNSVVAIPKGYHPVSAAPGYQLYYLWVLAGEKRILKPKDDPAHSWVKAYEAMLDVRC